MIDLFTTTRQFLRAEEVSELLSVSRRTVYYWIKNKKISSVHVAGSQRIPVDALRHLMPSDPPAPSFSSPSVQSAKRTA